MLMDLFQAVTQNPWALAFIGAYYFFYSIPAWSVVAVRILSRRFSRAEWLVLLCFLGCVFIEIGQFAVHSGRGYGTGKLWGYARYFGSLSPLLWIWAAALAGFAWKLAVRRSARRFVRLVLLGLIGSVFYSQEICFLKQEMTCGSGEDAWVAARRIAPIIRKDYKGPRRRIRRYSVHTGNDYYTDYRPVVFSQLAAAAWEVRGGSECVRHDPVGTEDYMFVRIGEGYYGKTQFKTSEYDFVAKVRGIFSEWVLLRRTGPSRK